jgi:hypothetical protein
MSARSFPCQVAIASFSLSLTLLAACTAPGVHSADPVDASIVDASVRSDGGMSDGGVSDGGASDGGVSDGGVSDGGVSDGGVSDGGVSDGGPIPIPQCAPASMGGLGAWQTTGSMADPARWGATATLLQNGDLLVAGGDPAMYLPYRGATPADLYLTAEIYSPATSQWRLAAPMSEGHQYHTATRLKDGRVLVAGGIGQECGVGCGYPTEKTAEVYDPIADHWTRVAPMHNARFQQAATLLTDGRVLVAGGLGLGCLASVEIYEPGSDTWTEAAPLNHSRCNGVAALTLSSGTVLIGGTAWNNATGSDEMAVELYDLDTGLWHDGALKPNPQGSLLMFPLPSGRAMVSYRYQFDAQGNPYPIADIFAPTTGTWTSTPPLSRMRLLPAGVQLSDGRVMLAGGQQYGNIPNYGSGAVDLFDESTGEWLQAADLPGPRQGLFLGPLGDGGALAIGGYEGCYQGSQYVSGDYLAVDRFIPNLPVTNGPP